MTRLLRTVQKAVGRAVPAAGAAYALTLHRSISATGRAGAAPTGGNTIDVTGLPLTLTSIAAGTKIKIGAFPQTFTASTDTAVSAGAVTALPFAPALPYPVTAGASVSFAHSADYPCQGLVTSYADYTVAQGTVRATDRRVLILGATLPSGVTPLPGDRITTPDDGVLVIIPIGTDGGPPVQSDPARAAFDCRCT